MNWAATQQPIFASSGVGTMISVDSNVIFSVVEPRDANHTEALSRLEASRRAEVLVISPVVYAELMASVTRGFIQTFLHRADIAILWAMPERVWEQAGIASGAYASIRRRGTLPRRIAADFLIAAHAKHHGLSVLTFDDVVFKAVFPEVRLV